MRENLGLFTLSHMEQGTFPSLEKLQRGDTDAWEEAFPHLWPAALRGASTRQASLSPSDAEEVAAEAMHELIGCVRKVNEFPALLPLVGRIAMYRAISRVRHNMATKRGASLTTSLESLVTEEGTAYDPPEPGSSRLSISESVELSHQLQELCDELGMPYVRIIELHYGRGMTLKEISHEMEIPLGTISVYMSRSMKRLRKKIQENPQLLKVFKDYLR